MKYFHMLPRCLEFYFYLISGTSIFLFQQKRRRYFCLRFLLSTGVSILTMNYIYYMFIVHNHSVNNLGNALIYVSALVFIFLIARFCFEISWSEACFCAVTGYTAQFVHSIIAEMTYRYFDINGIYQRLTLFGEALIIFSLIYYFFGRKLRKGQNFNVYKWHLMLLVMCAIMVEIVLCHNLRQPWIYALNKPLMVCECILLAICSIVMLAVQFGLLVQQDLTNELQVIKQMWRKDQEQYQMSKETIDLINRKCHDMRFQIRSIGKSANIVPAAIKDMEKSISIYDAIYKTGCRALDIILTEKSLFCQALGITIYCVADASKLTHLSDPEIYSLFGNILDNGINAVSQLADDERIISLTIRQRGEMLSINSHNFYSGEIVMQGGLPLTSSGNEDDHGFGTKSIAAIVRKYGGNVSFQAKDRVFNLNIIFSLDELTTLKSASA